jgi:hypothetical protein
VYPAAIAVQRSVNFSITSTHDNHPISPLIYGANQIYLLNLGLKTHFTPAERLRFSFRESVRVFDTINMYQKSPRRRDLGRVKWPFVTTGMG